MLNQELIFGNISNKRVYVTLTNNELIIKSGGMAIFNSTSTTKENRILLKEISSIEIDTPVLHPTKWTMTIVQNSRQVFIIKLFNTKQEKIAKQLKDEIIKLKNSNNSNLCDKDKYDKLGKLKKLLDDGVLSKEEFDK